MTHQIADPKGVEWFDLLHPRYNIQGLRVQHLAGAKTETISKSLEFRVSMLQDRVVHYSEALQARIYLRVLVSGMKKEGRIVYLAKAMSGSG